MTDSVTDAGGGLRGPLKQLRRLHTALPEGGSVTLSKADLGRLLEAKAERVVEGDCEVDLTVAQVAEKLDRAESTVRGWCAREVIPEAYKLRGREWRIPRAALRRFQQREAKNEPNDGTKPRRREDVSLSAWRKHRNGNG